MAALILVVLVLSVGFVCSGLFFHSIQLFDVEICIFCFEVLRNFGCLRMFHDVSHCFSCFLSFQAVGQFGLFYFFFVCCIFVHVGQLL